MKITIANYEEYVLDFLEGNLEQEDERIFNHFLDQHPDIREEINGVENYVLIPDYEIQYPNKNSLYRKDKGIYLPFWHINRFVAAAVALLLVSTATFFLWKSSVTRDQHTLATQKVLSDTNLYSGHSNIPAPTRTAPQDQASPGPYEKEPVNKAAEHKEKPPTHPDNSGLASSALPSVSSENTPVSEQQSGQSANEALVIKPAQINHPIEIDKELDLQDPEIPSGSDLSVQESAVAFLPVISAEINTDLNLKAFNPPALSSSLSEIASNPSASPSNPNSQTFRIHIPGEFLSETWTDVSLTNFKKKIIPDFIIKQLNQ